MASVYMGPLGSTQRVQGAIAEGQYAVRVIDGPTTMVPGEAVITKLMAALPGPVVVTLPVIDAGNLGSRVMLTNMSGVGIFELDITAPITLDFTNPGVLVVFRPAIAGGPNYLFDYQDSIVFVATKIEIDPPPPFPVPPQFFAWVQE